jgi:hypothetical protein
MGRVLAVLGVLAIVVAGFTDADGWLFRLGNAWAAVAFGLAHSLTFAAMPLRPAHERWRTFLGGAGFWLAMLFAVSWLVESAPEGMRRLFATAFVVLLAITLYAWIVFPVLRGKPARVMHEGHEADAHRNCCPRCGRWFDRALGRAPCTRCGLFVRLETVEEGEASFARTEPASGALAFGTSGMFCCPRCGKRARFLRGDSNCVKCGGRLRVNWNIHVDADIAVGPAQKVPRGERDV